MTLRLVVTAGLLAALPAAAATAQGFDRFITREGARLVDGTHEFRFVSFNIPNLHYVEDDLGFAVTNPWRVPDEFEIADGLQSIRQLGGRVVRIYALSVRRGDDDPEIPRHVIAPGEFGEDAFRALDKVLETANRTGVRLIVPFVDQWSWWGGISEYARFRGRPGGDFWTDPQIREDFKRTIAFVLDRRNTYTGTRYRDDKAVLAWETGNELLNPSEWSRDIAAYIKSLDPNHLVLDGFHAGLRGVAADRVDDPNVDIISTHHYPDFPVALLDAVERARTAIADRKPYVIGEVGFMPTATVRGLLDWVIDRGVSGALLWSLRVHHRDGGFFWHSEPAGGGVYKAYHWPGFPSGDRYDERALLGLMREKAFAIAGVPPDPVQPPDPPQLLPIRGPHAISWRGSTGATSYDVERATGPTGPWTLVGAGVDDASVPYAPVFADRWAVAGEQYYYRVRARNAGGLSAPSPLVGPVRTSPWTEVDELSDWTRAFGRSNLQLVSGDTRKAKEDLSRAAGDQGAILTYRAIRPLAGARVHAFFPSAIVDPVFETSSDGFNWTTASATRHDYSKGAGDYGYFKAVGYDVPIGPGQLFVRITLAGPTEIGRVELDSAATPCGAGLQPCASSNGAQR